VRVETWVRRRHRALDEQVTEGLFTFVAIDESGRPRAVCEAGAEASVGGRHGGAVSEGEGIAPERGGGGESGGGAMEPTTGGVR